jgi:hypothetical protein
MKMIATGKVTITTLDGYHNVFRVEIEKAGGKYIIPKLHLEEFMTN